MNTCTSRKRCIVLFTILMVILLLACRIGSTDRAELSNEEQVATGVAATQLARTPGALAVTAQPPAQQNSSTPSSTAVSGQPSIQQLTGAGSSRANPLPPGALVSVPSWDIQVLEYQRGQEALALINTGVHNAITAPAGKEIVLVKFFVRCTSFADKAFSLGINDLALTGDSHVLYGDQIDEWPQPEFYYYDMFTAEAVEGWLDAVVPTGETNLMAVVNLKDTDSDSPTYGTRFVRYIALEPGSVINLPAEYASRTANEVGLSTGSPAGVGQQVSMPEWDITLLEVMVGPEADALLQQNNSRYEAPEAGFEYSLWHFNLQYFGGQDWPVSISAYNFSVSDLEGYSIGNARNTYVQNPDRVYLNSTILPGAVMDGWVILQVPQAGTPYLVQFRYDSDSPGLTDETRYFSID